ncbi:hypothetical protein NOM68_18345, partial [Proteus mirabilis]|uniref:hypothetical protein n=1 Tax=Proteus mirabilis TaxID=584 RepID=UPI00217EFA9C
PTEFKREELKQYQIIDYQEDDPKQSLIVNPYNGSSLGVTNYGLYEPSSQKLGQPDIGIRLVDQYGEHLTGSLPDGGRNNNQTMPGASKEPYGPPEKLYAFGNEPRDIWGRRGEYNQLDANNGIQSFQGKEGYDDIITLKKQYNPDDRTPEKLMQLVFDDSNDVLYAFEGSATRNFNALI